MIGASGNHLIYNNPMMEPDTIAQVEMEGHTPPKGSFFQHHNLLYPRSSVPTFELGGFEHQHGQVRGSHHND